MNHIYTLGRCIFCNANSLDVFIYDNDEICDQRDDQPLSYTTSTNSAPVQSHGQPL